MTSAEWQARVRAMLLARAFSEEQWRLLSNSRIEDADAATLDAQRDLRSLTPQQLSDRINALLETNPDIFRQPALPPTGWYLDWAGRYRWWDGLQWTAHVGGVALGAAAVQSAPSAPGWYDDGTGRLRQWTGQQWA